MKKKTPLGLRAALEGVFLGKVLTKALRLVRRTTMSRRPLKWVKYGDIPVEFTAAHRQEIEEKCDDETSWWCYCGRLATGLHTSSCRQYRKHFQTKIEELYNDRT